MDLSSLKGVGPRRLKEYNSIGITTIEELASYNGLLPFKGADKHRQQALEITNEMKKNINQSNQFTSYKHSWYGCIAHVYHGCSLVRAKILDTCIFNDSCILVMVYYIYRKKQYKKLFSFQYLASVYCDWVLRDCDTSDSESECYIQYNKYLHVTKLNEIKLEIILPNNINSNLENFKNLIYEEVKFIFQKFSN